MAQATRELLERALMLAPADRAVLVVELVASLDGEESADQGEAAWADEIERRVREMPASGAALPSADEVFAGCARTWPSVAARSDEAAPLPPWLVSRSSERKRPETPKAAHRCAAFVVHRGDRTAIEPWIERFRREFCLAPPADFDLAALEALAA